MRSNSSVHAHPSNSGCSGHRNHSHDHNHQDHPHDHDHGKAEKFSEAADLCADTNGGAITPSHPPNVHDVQRKAYARKLKRVTVFVVLFFGVEMAGGIMSGSLAIASDAAHLLTDIIGWVLAIVANEVAGLPPSERLTFGPVRAEVLSALFSTLFILVLSVGLAYSAVWRLIDLWRGEAAPIDGRLMTFIALLGIFVNIALLMIFAHDENGRCQAHRHRHGPHDDGCGDHDHNDHHGHCDEEGALVANHNCGPAAAPTTTTTALATGVGERSSLMETLSANFNYARHSIVGGNSVNSEAEVGSTSSSLPSLTEHYGSIAELTEARLGVEEHEEEIVQKNINVEAAMLHAVTDLVQSFGVLLAGLMIWYDPRWQWADPISTLFFVGLVINSTRWLLARAFNVLLEGVPEEINYSRLKSRLTDISGVVDVNRLHVWSLTMGQPVVSAHIKAHDPESALIQAHQICRRMGIDHATIQVQKDDGLSLMHRHPCSTIES